MPFPICALVLSRRRKREIARDKGRDSPPSFFPEEPATSIAIIDHADVQSRPSRPSHEDIEGLIGPRFRLFASRVTLHEESDVRSDGSIQIDRGPEFGNRASGMRALPPKETRFAGLYREENSAMETDPETRRDSPLV